MSKTNPRRLVIVESPAKARTISRYLGDGYVVESSIGHIRDLPDRASEIPKDERAKFGALGVAIDDGFEPYYVVDADKKRVVADLKKKLKDVDELLLATDEDREGEAIAWHLVDVLKPKVPVRRMVFHEITRDAILRALDQTRDVDDRLVDAQETRRILDRLYGYEVSPVLWKKVMRGLSAGRVQSVATRLVVERERARMRFVAAAYWDLAGTFDPGSFDARLVSLDGKRVAQGRDFAEDGQLKADAAQLDESRCTRSRRTARGRRVHRQVDRGEAVFAQAVCALQDVDPAAGGEPQAPLQRADDDARRPAPLRSRAHHVHAHRLDDALEAALAAARRRLTELYGAESVPGFPSPLRDEERENAQEAHEAIRPAGDRFRPQGARGELDRDELALYELVWMRTIASQMADAKGKTVSLRIGAESSARRGRRIRRRRHRDHVPRLPRRLRRGARRGAGRGDEARLPAVEEGQALALARPRGAGSRDDPAARLHRGDACAGARGARHRPPVHVRLDPLDDRRPGLRVQARTALVRLPRLRRHAAARAALRHARRLPVHRAHGGRSRPDRRRQRGSGRLAHALLQG